MIDIPAIQSVLGEFGIDGWLLYDFRGSNLLAERVLGLAPSNVGSRRYAYCIPAKGEPRKLVHRIERGPRRPARLEDRLSQMAGIRGGARPIAGRAEAGGD